MENTAFRIAELERENALLKSSIYIDDLTVTGLANDKQLLKAQLQKAVALKDALCDLSDREIFLSRTARQALDDFIASLSAA
jgi:hypothetical protein